MTIWIIEPHDPLIFRDGRPFGATPGARAKSLPFPFPSTIAGGVRARAGLRDGIFQVQSEKLEDLKKLKVQGPLLIQLPRSGYAITPANLLVPAPGDAILFEEEKEEEQRKQLPEEVQKQLIIEKLKQNLPEAVLASEKIQDELNDIVEYKLAVGVVKRLLPVQLTGAEYSAFRVGENEEDKEGGQSKLMLVGLEKADASKPLKEAPHYWYWDHFVAWLLAPERYHQKVLPLHLLGHSGPKYELRVHVSIDANTRTGEDGALFDTSGLEFTYRGKLPETSLAQAERLALAVNVEESQDFRLKEGPGNLGGERRLVSWHKSESSLFPNCPEKLEAAIIDSGGHCRLLLLTPAYFDKGYQPDWLQKKRCGVEVKVRACLIQRAQVVSGWDMAVSTKESPGGERKATRRLVPAGSVYYLALTGSADDIRAWIRETWMQCVSDGDAEKLDGFGLAVLGTWSGTAVEMKVSEKEKRA